MSETTSVCSMGSIDWLLWGFGLMSHERLIGKAALFVGSVNDEAKA
jgi:hypothetical protein